MSTPNAERAKEAWANFIANFEKEYGYYVAAFSEPSFNSEGLIKVATKLKLVPVPRQLAETPENPANTPDNGNIPTKETSEGDSGEQPKA